MSGRANDYESDPRFRSLTGSTHSMDSAGSTPPDSGTDGYGVPTPEHGDPGKEEKKAPQNPKAPPPSIGGRARPDPDVVRVDRAARPGGDSPPAPPPPPPARSSPSTDREPLPSRTAPSTGREPPPPPVTSGRDAVVPASPSRAPVDRDARPSPVPPSVSREGPPPPSRGEPGSARTMDNEIMLAPQRGDRGGPMPESRSGRSPLDAPLMPQRGEARDAAVTDRVPRKGAPTGNAGDIDSRDGGQKVQKVTGTLTLKDERTVRLDGELNDIDTVA